MATVSFSETLNSRHFSYLLHTSTNGVSNKIISSVFRDGQIVLASNLNYEDDLSETALQEMVEHFHLKKRTELTMLFELAEQFADTNNIKIVGLISRALLRKNLVDEAIRFMTLFHKILGQEDSLHKILGQAYLQNNDFQNAVQALNKAIALKPNYADYHNLLGVAYLKQNSCSMAAMEFRTAIKLNLYFAEAYFHLGLTFIKNAVVKDDYDLSLNLEENTKKALESATKINPAYLHAGFHTAMEALHQHEYQKSLNLFEEAQKKVRKNDPRIAIEEFNLKLLHTPDAVDIIFIWEYIKELNNLSRQFPGYADLCNDLGIAYSLLGTFFQKESIDFFDKALQRNPNYLAAKKNHKLQKNENRGLKYLQESLLNLQMTKSASGKKGIKINFS